MPNLKLEFYRDKVEECRQKAAEAKMERDREQWLKLSRDWQAMADRLERNGWGDVPVPGRETD